MSLKDCFRAYHQLLAQEAGESSDLKGAKAGSVHIPFRSSPLTRVLKACFQIHTSEHATRGPQLTAIVTTISPSPIDIQHTLNSLDHVVPISPRLSNLVLSNKSKNYEMAKQYILKQENNSTLLSVPTSIAQYPVTEDTVEVPLIDKASIPSHSDLPVDMWTHEQLVAWMATVHSGKLDLILCTYFYIHQQFSFFLNTGQFADLIIPKGMYLNFK